MGMFSPVDLSSYTTRKRLLRKVLGLPGEQPDPVNLQLVPVDADSPYFTIKKRSAAEQEEQVKAWHAEDWRADAAEKIARIPDAITSTVDSLRFFAERKLAEKKLEQATTLTYRSSYVHAIGETSDVEGYFDLDGATYSLTVVAMGGLSNKYVENAWNEGELIHGGNNLLGGENTVYVPGDSLNDALVEEALLRWYEDRFEYHRRHWTHLTSRKVTIKVDLAWEKAEDLYPAP
jgi:hypothetical protein